MCYEQPPTAGNRLRGRYRNRRRLLPRLPQGSEEGRQDDRPLGRCHAAGRRLPADGRERSQRQRRGLLRVGRDLPEQGRFLHDRPPRSGLIKSP